LSSDWEPSKSVNLKFRVTVTSRKTIKCISWTFPEAQLKKVFSESNKSRISPHGVSLIDATLPLSRSFLKGRNTLTDPSPCQPSAPISFVPNSSPRQDLHDARGGAFPLLANPRRQLERPPDLSASEPSPRPTSSKFCAQD